MPTSSQNHARPQIPTSRLVRLRRPAAALACCAFALMGWLRFSTALAYRAELLGFGFSPQPLYFILSGLALGLAFSLAALFIIVRARFAPVVARAFCLAFLAAFWVERVPLGTRAAFFRHLETTVLISLLTLTLAFILVRPADYRKDQHSHDL